MNEELLEDGLRTKGFIWGVSCEALSELIFIGLPIAILFVVNAYKGGDFIRVTLFSSEFGVASCIILGQSIAKLTAEFSQLGKDMDKGGVAFFIALLVSVLIMATIFLAIVMIAGGGTPEWVYYLQLLMFVIAIVVHFIYFGVVKHVAIIAEKKDE